MKYPYTLTDLTEKLYIQTGSYARPEYEPTIATCVKSWIIERYPHHQTLYACLSVSGCLITCHAEHITLSALSMKTLQIEYANPKLFDIIECYIDECAGYFTGAPHVRVLMEHLEACLPTKERLVRRAGSDWY